MKMNLEENTKLKFYNYKNKTIVADGGNSEGGAAKYQGANIRMKKLLLLTQQ